MHVSFWWRWKRRKGRRKQEKKWNSQHTSIKYVLLYIYCLCASNFFLTSNIIQFHLIRNHREKKTENNFFVEEREREYRRKRRGLQYTSCHVRLCLLSVQLNYIHLGMTIASLKLGIHSGHRKHSWKVGSQSNSEKVKGIRVEREIQA